MKAMTVATVLVIFFLTTAQAPAGDIALLASENSGVYGLGYPRYPAPYPKDWDRHIGYDFWTRLTNYYALEMGHDAPPPDPTAPASRRPDWTPAPQSTPPYPFTEWPYGGATSIGVTRPNSVDSPLMTALAKTPTGKALNDAHIQIYGWINFGGNAS